MSTDIVEVKARYDNQCTIGDPGCVITINVDEKMKKTVHVYYELHGFFQNNRLYMRSVSREQLKGESISHGSASSDCGSVNFIGSFSNL